MSGWEKVKLGDVLRFFNGKSIKPLAEGKYVVYGSNGPIGRSDEFQYENAIIIGRVGAACGCVAREQGKFWASDNTIVVVTHDTADIDFVFYQLSTMTLNRYAGGSAQPLVTQRILKDLEIALPPLAEQRRIAGVLRTYDEAIENCRRQISLLEEAAQNLYRNRFLSGNKDNWESVSILDNDVFRFVSPKVTPFRGEKLYYATADVDGTGIVGQGEFVSFDNRPSRASIQPIPNSVWFARMSNSYKILCFIEGCGGLENRCIISSGFAGFSSAPEHFGYVYCTIASRLFDEMKNRFATGATQVSLTNEGLGKISVRLPPREAIRDFSSIVLPYLKNAELLRCQIKSFSEARDRLLPRLLSGEASA